MRKELEIRIGDYIRRYEMRENYISLVTIGGVPYHILGTYHTLQRLKERGIDKYKVAAMVLALGEKLEQYNNSGKHVVVHGYGATCVFTVERNVIVLITVIDKDRPFIINEEKTVEERLA